MDDIWYAQARKAKRGTVHVAMGNEGAVTETLILHLPC